MRGLDDDIGVWFSYTTSYAQEAVSLQLAFPIVSLNSMVGVQVADGDQLFCVAYGYEFGPIDWTAERGIQYMILITWNNPADSFMFELQLQSRGAGSSASPSPTGQSTVPPPGTSPTGGQAVPTSSATSPVGETSSNQTSSDAGTGFSSTLMFSGLLALII